MSYEWFIARRYLTARRKQAFISVITSISTLGITIGVMALIIAIALITGFQDDVQEKILGSTAHVMIRDWSGDGLEDYKSLADRVARMDGVISATPVVYDSVMIIGPYQSQGGGLLRAMDFEQELSQSSWLRELERGELPERGARREGILLGRDLAFSVGAGVGDVVTVISPSNRLSPLGMSPKFTRMKVTGIYATGLYEWDSTTALVWLDAGQRIFGLGDKINLIQIRIDQIFDAPKIRDRIREFLPEETHAMTWMEMNESLFSALKLEKRLMFFTITLIVIVAALNIIATLILMVMEKTRDIGVLKAMGASSRSIMRIFFLQGSMIGVFGTIIGTALGLFWCFLANTFELIKLPVDIYMIAFVPFRIKVLDLLAIVGVALLISFLSTLFPSHRAARVDPVNALKYE
ncbi:MAG: FtsX-like permease family protein [Candidatus Aminicenantaceae bacterium]